MSDAEIGVRVRVKDARRFRAEAKGVANSVDEIGDQAAQADRRVKRLGRSLLLTRIFNRLTAAGDGASASLGGVVTNVRTLWLVALAAAPVLVILAGALAAVAGSAGAAALGAGALGGGGIAALVVGLGGLGIVTAQAAVGLKKVGDALTAYNIAVRQYGHGTSQAVGAQAHLNAVIAQYGGEPIYQAVKAWRALTSEFTRLTRASRTLAAQGFGDALKAARRILPTFAQETNRNAGAMRRAMGGLFATLSGREAQGGLRSFGATFRGMLGPGVRGMTDLLVGLLRIARAAGPHVVSLMRSFERLAHAFRSWTSDQGKMKGVVGGLVGHTRSWLRLASALGRVLFHLFSAGASEGKGLVDSLAAILNRWDRWLTSVRGSAEVRRFFTEVGAQARIVVAGLGKLVVAAGSVLHAIGPAFAAALRGAATALGKIAHFLKPVLSLARKLKIIEPLVALFIAWKVATLALAAAQTLVAFAFNMTPLGRAIALIALLVGGFVLAYKKVGWFRTAVDAVWKWIKLNWRVMYAVLAHPIARAVGIMVGRFGTVRRAIGSAWHWVKGHWPLLLGILTGPFAPVVTYVARHFGEVKRIVKSVFDYIARRMRSLLRLPGRIKGLVTKLPGKALGAAKGIIPGLATGGIVTHPGSVLVGEVGPELLTLRPPARVDPLPRVRPRHRIDPPSPLGRLSAHAASVETTVPVALHLDGKVIAEAVARVTRNQYARR